MPQPILSHQLFRAGAAHPFLRAPIEQASLVPDDTVDGLGTDGARIFFAPGAALEDGAAEHLIVHCLFRHMRVPERAIRPLWDLACDLSAEYLRAELFSPRDAQRTRLRVAEALPEGVDPRLPAAVYRALGDRFEDELEPLYARFRRDDHRYWYAPPTPEIFPRDHGQGTGRAYDPADGLTYAEWVSEAADSLWPSADQLPGGLSRTGRYGLAPGSRQERMLLREAGKYDFSRYLRRYSSTREELRLDPASFDYIPYCYGLERYGNLPLIEPLEYSESHRVETLVIAIDTSGSCTRPVVERFLGEIEGMLMDHDAFFERMNVHIIQCDAAVQSDTAIHSLDDWRAYTQNLVIKGRSGTDFRPVFDWVGKLLAKGELRDLKGLMYFTDGDGAYPQEKPPYETAFVFSTRKALAVRKPEWIIPLCLDTGVRQ